MKKGLLLFVAAAFISTGFASTAIEAPGIKKLNAHFIMIPVGETGQKISLMQLSTISRGDLESMTGRKMNVFQKLVVKKLQKRLKKGIAADGTITDNKINKLQHDYKGKSGFHFGGFALGLILGCVGVLVA